MYVYRIRSSHERRLVILPWQYSLDTPRYYWFNFHTLHLAQQISAAGDKRYRWWHLVSQRQILPLRGQMGYFLYFSAETWTLLVAFVTLLLVWVLMNEYWSIYFFQLLESETDICSILFRSEFTAFVFTSHIIFQPYLSTGMPTGLMELSRN